MTKKFNIQTASWSPTIIRVENGYIMNLESPTIDKIETYVFETYEDVTDFLKEHFGIEG